ncbi:MAG: PIN domain-containing protein [Candidatus Thorarchaeota archaeon]
MPRYCIDATALVIYINEEKPDKEFQKIIKEIEANKSTGFMSMVNLAEFHRAITRIYSEDKADKYVIWLKESKIILIPPSLEISTLASVKKQKYASTKEPFAWGDAFCLATAIEYDADFIITDDPEFKKVKEIPIIFI